MSTKKAGATCDRRTQNQLNSYSSLHGQGGSVNPDAETIALLSETVWLLTGIYNLQVAQLYALETIKSSLP